MNAERKFLFACLIFALVIYAIHAFGLFNPHQITPLTDTHPPERIVGYSLYILLFIIATLFLLPGSILVIAGGIVFGPLFRDTTLINCRHAGLLVLIPAGALAGT